MISNTEHEETIWEIDLTHSNISFRVKHLMITHVEGHFTVYKGTIVTTGNDFSTAKIRLWIEVDSIHTGDEIRDAHLKGKDFFNSTDFTSIYFRSENLIKVNNDARYVMIGELTMKGLTHTIELNVVFGGTAIDAQGSTYGLLWNKVLETGGLNVSDEVTIACEMELRKQVTQDVRDEFKPIRTQDFLTSIH
jgi:polyisoprenoid-binding protein YceI